MNQLKVKTINGEDVIIGKKIASGGQGSIYNATYRGQDVVLKWYHESCLKNLGIHRNAFYNNLCKNAISGSPSNSFIWPLYVVKNEDGSRFGYIMKRIPDGYYAFTDFVNARKHFDNIQIILQAAINICKAYLALHNEGLAYQDISPSNFYINPHTGDVLICDNDNAAPEFIGFGGGTPSYIAPEVIRGEKTPDTNTDLFSIAVMLHLLFFMTHPLEGSNCYKYPCLTIEAIKQLYAVHPVYILSKEDKSNAPARGTCSNLEKLWPIYPKYLHDAFRHAFSEENLHDGNLRMTERDWLTILYRLEDESIRCQKCGEITFVTMCKGRYQCVNCKEIGITPVLVKVDQYMVAANPGKNISEYHTINGERKKIVGSFVESKKTKGVFGLRNDSNYVWAVKYPGESIINYEHGKVVTLKPNTEIVVGKNTLKVIKNI